MLHGDKQLCQLGLVGVNVGGPVQEQLGFLLTPALLVVCTSTILFCRLDQSGCSRFCVCSLGPWVVGSLPWSSHWTSLRRSWLTCCCWCLRVWSCVPPFPWRLVGRPGLMGGRGIKCVRVHHQIMSSLVCCHVMVWHRWVCLVVCARLCVAFWLSNCLCSLALGCLCGLALGACCLLGLSSLSSSPLLGALGLSISWKCSSSAVSVSWVGLVGGFGVGWLGGTRPSAH